MVDWLLLWGITQGLGVIVTPIIQELAKEGAKDFAKDFFKDSLKKVFFSEKDPRQIAAGKAIKEFLQLVQQQLKVRCKLTESEIKQYTPVIKEFINDKTIKSILGQAFDLDCESLDAQTLQNTWNKLQLKPLPDKFNWESVTAQYLPKVQEILFDSQDLREILNSQNLKSIADNTQELAGIIPGFDLIGYQETIRETYGNLKLESLDTSGYAYNELKLWRIFIAQNVREVHQVLPQIYELPKEHLRQLRESDQIEAEINLQELEKYKKSYFDQPIRSVLDIINQKQNHKYLVILGDPGSGKSSLLQFLALNWAESPLDNIISQPIPLLIELRTYVRNREEGHCKNFLEFSHQCSGAIHHLNQHQLHEQLKAGKVLVMFDGLDEIFDLGQREDVITDIHRFTNEYPQVQVIVTSRIIGYKPQRLRDAEFRHFMLQDLDKEQIQDFVNRWHDLTFNDQADKIRKKERLERALYTSKAIKELAGNPLLLTMMAILNRHQELPRDRAELYYQASRVLLHQWDVERALIEDSRLDPKTIDYRDKQAMLRQVAYQMQANEKSLVGNSNIIKVNDLERILTDYLKTIEIDKPREAARVMINQLRTRNFILCSLGADYYAFVHRTFLEYFCAWSFVWQFKETQTLTIEQLKTEVFGKHWHDEKWHEVLRLIAGMIEPKFTGEIIDYLISENGVQTDFQNLFLASELLLEVRKLSDIETTAHRIFQYLKELSGYIQIELFENSSHSTSRVASNAISAIVRIWKDDKSILFWLKTIINSDADGMIRKAALRELASGWKDDHDTLPLLKYLIASDEDEWVQSAALEELASGWKDDCDTFPLLKSLAISGRNNSICRVSIEALSKGWKDDPDTLTLLKRIIQSDQDRWVRQVAVRELANVWKDDPDTLTFLRKIAQSDNDYWLRQVAVKELASRWEDDPDSLNLLQNLFQSDQNGMVRAAVVEKLAKLNKHNFDTLLWLKTIICSDKDGWVQRAAILALCEIWKDEPDVLSILKQSTQRDKDSWLRKAAIKELAKGWKDDPDTLTMLKSIAQSDEEYELRQIAIQEVAKGWKDESDILTILKSIVQSDKISQVRQVAMQELVKGWKNELETLNIIKHLAQFDDSQYVRQAGLQELAKAWRDAPGMFNFLSDRFKNDIFKSDRVRGYNLRQITLDLLIKQYFEHPDMIMLLCDIVENDPDEKVREFAQKKLAELEKQK
ncbi:MAG TPA: HEAT repeat domain-containing protein [Nostocaceae cyanobacterium]|nr:HEAT repeat domain-containing protein [Nostocaceae cyanobacterium]